MGVIPLEKEKKRYGGRGRPVKIWPPVYAAVKEFAKKYRIAMGDFISNLTALATLRDLVLVEKVLEENFEFRKEEAFEAANKLQELMADYLLAWFGEETEGEGEESGEEED